MEQFTAPFTVMRLLTPLKMSYEVATKRAEPYTKIVGELPDMRKEAVVLIKDAIGHNRRAYVLVNNRLEGNAPLTVQALTANSEPIVKDGSDRGFRFNDPRTCA